MDVIWLPLFWILAVLWSVMIVFGRRVYPSLSQWVASLATTTALLSLAAGNAFATGWVTWGSFGVTLAAMGVFFHVVRKDRIGAAVQRARLASEASGLEITAYRDGIDDELSTAFTQWWSRALWMLVPLIVVAFALGGLQVGLGIVGAVGLGLLPLLWSFRRPSERAVERLVQPDEVDTMHLKDG